MGKWKGVVLIFVIQIIYLFGCSSEKVKEEPKPVEKEVSCTFNQLDGECRVFSSFVGDQEWGNSYSICTLGTCSEGDCENGKGTLSYPGGSKLEGTFKKGKLNGAGSYEGCGSSYTGTFKDSLKGKGVLITKTKSNRDEDLVQYYDGSSQDEMRNGKGIYYSSSDSNIYEGTWKDDVKNGTFVVYSNFRGDFPLSEKGTVLKTAYDGSKKVTYVNDRDKEEIDQEERDRKYQAIKEAKEREERRKQDIRKAQYEKERMRAYQACRKAVRSSISVRGWDYMGRMNWYNADLKCRSNGMRLPTIDELKAAYEAGMTKTWNFPEYWSSSSGGSIDHYYMFSLLSGNSRKESYHHDKGVICSPNSMPWICQEF